MLLNLQEFILKKKFTYGEETMEENCNTEKSFHRYNDETLERGDSAPVLHLEDFEENDFIATLDNEQSNFETNLAGYT